MEGKRALAIALLAAAAPSCALLSGLSDLVVDDAALPDGGGSPDVGEASTSRPDDASIDAGLDAAKETGADASSAGDAGGDAGSDGAAPRPPACDELGLVARWQLDEASGSVAYDCTSNHHDGVLQGAVSRTTGHLGGALAFTNGYVVAPDSPALDLTSDMTLCAWTKEAAGNPDGGVRIAAKAAILGTDGYGIGTYNTGYHVAVTTTGGVANLVAGQREIGVYHHVAVVFREGATMMLYRDGTLVTTANTPNGAQVTTAEPFSIGSRPDGTAFFAGVIDDVRLYDRALDASEIQTLASQ